VALSLTPHLPAKLETTCEQASPRSARLKDIDDPVVLHHLVIEGLASLFSSLRKPIGLVVLRLQPVEPLLLVRVHEVRLCVLGQRAEELGMRPPSGWEAGSDLIRTCRQVGAGGHFSSTSGELALFDPTLLEFEISGRFFDHYSGLDVFVFPRRDYDY
jgi:hypothetical protein